MPQYETIFLLPADAGPKNLKQVEEKLEKIIQPSKGQIKNVDDWGIRKLSYLIKKQPRAHFLYLNYTASAEIQAEITRVFNIDEQVLRFANARLPDDYDYTKAKQTFLPESSDDYRGAPRRGGSGGGYRQRDAEMPGEDEGFPQEETE